MCMHIACVRSSLASEDAPCKGSEFQHFPIFCDAQIMLKRSVSTRGEIDGVSQSMLCAIDL